ncbi:hypothetical protein [Actinospica robiniae]|uniref:hypothetical protein n=1 Tax=Actinospica robiniae TaxID=304901 RepID=UPI00040953AA|nr:hypothetical protein [Actinospica robiniae]
MAKYSVTVCLSPGTEADLPIALTKALAPFAGDTDLDWDFGYMWDSWRVRGGNDGYGFWVRPGCEDDPRLIHDGLGSDGVVPDLPSLPGLCAGGPRELLDLSEEPELGRTLAVEAWELWHRLADTHPLALPYELISHRLQSSPRGSVDSEQARREYAAQPLIAAYEAAHPLGGRDPRHYSAEVQFRPGALRHARLNAQTFADSVVSQHLGGWDLLTLDGWWIGDDGAAHHGTCGSACIHRPDAYNDARGNANYHTGKHRYLEALPPETILVRIYGRC